MIVLDTDVVLELMRPVPNPTVLTEDFAGRVLAFDLPSVVGYADLVLA